LIGKIAIGGNHEVEAFALSRIKQIAVLELLPSQLNRSGDIVPGQMAR
jgi:hypothetical protein